MFSLIQSMAPGLFESSLNRYTGGGLAASFFSKMGARRKQSSSLGRGASLGARGFLRTRRRD